MVNKSQNHPHSSSERCLRWPEVRQRVGYSRSQIHNLIKQGRFPRPIKLGARASAWLQSSIDAWIQDRVAASGPEEQG